MDLVNLDKPHYVYDGIEVVLTGRKAIKANPLNARKAVGELYEIEPADNPGLWKKWIRKEQLYEIV